MISNPCRLRKIMEHQHDACPIRGHIFQAGYRVHLVRRIKIGERFIGEHPFRLSGQHTCEQNTRLFTARQAKCFAVGKLGAICLQHRFFNCGIVGDRFPPSSLMRQSPKRDECAHVDFPVNVRLLWQQADTARAVLIG